MGNLYRLMRGYAEGGYVGGAGSPAQMRRAEGINFNQNNHVVIQNDGINGQAGPQLMKAVYDMARKGRRMSSGCSCVMAVCYQGAGDENISLESEAGYGGELAAIGA